MTNSRATVAPASADATAFSAPAAAGAVGSYGEQAPAGRTDVLRIVLWTVLGLSATGNLVASIIGAGTGPHLLFGAVSALSGVTLGVRFLRAHR
ncbi:hypothetical protein [Streptomyces nodosus]|uniref:hypothetical protein n=1 Tax=Streptomyces nodosus TaxID=40318 RepID=UPI0038099CD2